MEKIPITILASGILFLAGSLSLYFYQTNYQRENKTKYCTELGIKRRTEQKNEIEKRNENSPIFTSITEPKYYYNPRIDACLYRYELTERNLNSDPSRRFEVIDLLTNKPILSWDNISAEDTGTAYFEQNKIADLLFQGETLEEAEKEVLKK